MTTNAPQMMKKDLHETEMSPNTTDGGSDFICKIQKSNLYILMGFFSLKLFGYVDQNGVFGIR